MTSTFDVIAHEDNNDQSKVRQASALAHQRVEDRFGLFVRKGSIEDQGSRYDLVAEDIRAVVAAACEQVGYADVDAILASIGNNFISEPQARKIAGTIHEARKPKMCPYHSEVTDISLAAGEAQAGYNAMSSHAWGEKHCQGAGYEGDRCKFKPAMTTQAFWDDKAEKAETRRQERAEQLEQEQQVQELPQAETPVEEPAETTPEPVSEVSEIHEHSEPSAIGEGVDEAPVTEEPMLMAAKTAAPVAVPKMDKRKWTPKTVGEVEGIDDSDGPHPTKRKDVTEPIKSEGGDTWNPSKLEEIGEQVTEHQDVTKDSDNIKGEGGSFPGSGTTAVSSLLDTDTVAEALSKFKRD